MELMIHNLSNIKVFPLEKKVALQYQISTKDKLHANSLHLLRKHNEFTHQNPNLYINLDEDSTNML
jgi:hypothetical protein